MAFIASAWRTLRIGGRLWPAVAAFLLLQTSPASAQPGPGSLSVQEERGVYTVLARFVVESPPSVALAVLMDYGRIPRFMPGVRSSTVLERAGGRIVVEQEAVSGVLMFSKRVHLVLEIDEQPDALLFRDRCGRSFVQYHGAWRIADEAGRTSISYELTAEPSFDVPGFMLRRILKRDSSDMMQRLQREISERAALPAVVHGR
jgi:ribosome-associated toxin RatA of RatAB toxin-antitoxin module